MADAFAIVPFDDSDDEGTVSMAHKGGGGGGAAVATRVTFRVAINPNAVRDREGEGVSIHGSIEVTHAPHSLMSFSACVIFRCSSPARWHPSLGNNAQSPCIASLVTCSISTRRRGTRSVTQAHPVDARPVDTSILTLLG